MTPHRFRPQCRSGTRPAAGFTLLELLVVVVVLGILVGIAGIPAVDDSEHALDLAEVQVRDALRTARARAVAMRRPHGVAFDLAGERFAVVDDLGTAAENPVTHGVYVVDFARPDQPEGMDIQSADFGGAGAAAIFDGQGVPLVGGTLVLRNGDHVRTLVLDEATGLVSAY